MKEEYNALMKNGTWSLVSRASNTNVVDGKCLYRLKRDKNGAITRYKEIFVAKDIQNAFLLGNLKEHVYMKQTPGFIDPQRPNHVCSKTDPSLFIYSRGDTLVYILVYVDDIIVTINNKGTIDNIICQLGSAFALKDLGLLNYFLGIEIVPHMFDILLSQKNYILELLQSIGLSNCNLVSSPMVTSSPLSLDDSTVFSNPVKYRQVVGYLQYVTLSRPDIAFAVNKVCQYMHAPTKNHWSSVKRILCYLHGTVKHGMLISRSFGFTLQAFTNVLWKGNPDTSLEAFSDADWNGDSDDRRCIGGFAIYLGSNLISWTACKQRTVLRSSTEAETRLLLTLLLSSHSFKLFLMSLESFHLQLLYYDVTILVQHTCQLTLSFISVPDTKLVLYPLQDKLTSRDKSLDLSAFKLSAYSLVSCLQGLLVVGDRMGLNEPIATTH
ncbi:putative RNA-directed DNA polymerase [Tanacetum coccineum]